MKTNFIGWAMGLAFLAGSQWPAADAAAQSQSYDRWADPNAPKAASGQSDGNTQRLVDELNRLIDDADRARAADPRFLRDLRALARQYEYPWRTSVLLDEFRDGDFTNNPKWSVTRGTFWVERGFGLRASFDEPREKQKASGSAQQESGGGDLAGQLLGALLSQALNSGGERSGGNSSAAPKELPAAAIHVDAAISNAFAIDLELTSWREEGRLEIGPYQGQTREPGYRLVYRSGGTPSIELLRVSSRGTSVVEAVGEIIKFEDKKPHRIFWTRDRFGEMIVKVDERQVIKVTDRGFRDSFSGFSWVNRGGDYILRRIRIDGAG